MPKTVYQTTLPLSDGGEDLWRQEVVPRLPVDLEQKARELKAFERARGLPDATTLLRGLLAYVLCAQASSFRRLGAWGVLMGVANMSDTAWRKHLVKASAWLLWLLGTLLAVDASPPKRELAGRVLLIDATRLREEGGCGDDWRVHSAYDLQVGRLVEVKVTDRHTGESLRHFALQAGDIVVADNGYGYRSNVAYAQQQQAFVVLFITPTTFPLETEQGKAISLVSWLKQKGEPVRSRTAWCGFEGQRYEVRVVALKLPAQVARRRREEKRRHARQKGKKISATTVFLAGWILLVTTLPAQQWSAQEVLKLYRARWQTELLYKRLKQQMRCAQVRAHLAEAVQAELRAYLLAWVLQEQEAQALREVLEGVHTHEQGRPETWEWDEHPVSEWRVSSLCVDTLRGQVLGQWSAQRVRICAPDLQRYLRSSPRMRSHQASTTRRWLATKRKPPSPVHARELSG